MRRIRILSGILLAGIGAAHAQEDPMAVPLFVDDTPLELTIEGPFDELSSDGDERPERESLLRYRDSQGEEVALPVDIRIRGHSRLEICGFPPLRLDFPKSQLEGTVFAGQNRLKLVTLCRDRDVFRDYLVQEYQIYLAFSALTDRSFQVRRAIVEYVESDSDDGESFTEQAFLIEEDWAVADRHGMEVLEVESLELTDLNPRHTALLSLFHYMIGSTDWSAISAPEGDNCCHNGAVLNDAEEGAFVIPYDFDQTGIINTSYAKPNPILPIRRVTQRLYRGLCLINDELEWAVGRLNEQREQVVGAFDSELVRERQRNVALKFIRESYDIINDPEQFEEEIIEECRGPARAEI